MWLFLLEKEKKGKAGSSDRRTRTAQCEKSRRNGRGENKRKGMIIEEYGVVGGWIGIGKGMMI